MTFDPDEVITPNATTPEHRLWATCFIDGVREALRARRARLSAKGQGLRHPSFDEMWLYDETMNHVGSFNWICELFEQDPAKVRGRVMKNQKEMLKHAA